MADAARQWWTANGFEIAAIDRIEIGGTDTRGIYRLSSNDARGALDRLGALSVDAVLMTGTGMPSLALLADPPAGTPPLVGSNLSLAEAVAQRLGIRLGDWKARLAAARGEPA
jgi:maleate isomerase